MMKAKDIAQALGTKTKSNSSWQVQCVAHEDRSPSMRITDGGDKILLHCYAGCSFESMRDVLKSRGLWPDSTDEQKAVWLEKKQEQEYQENMIWIACAEGSDKLTKSERAKLNKLRKQTARYRLKHGII